LVDRRERGKGSIGKESRRAIEERLKGDGAAQVEEHSKGKRGTTSNRNVEGKSVLYSIQEKRTGALNIVGIHVLRCTCGGMAQPLPEKRGG